MSYNIIDLFKQHEDIRKMHTDLSVRLSMLEGKEGHEIATSQITDTLSKAELELSHLEELIRETFQVEDIFIAHGTVDYIDFDWHIPAIGIRVENGELYEKIGYPNIMLLGKQLWMVIGRQDI